MSRLLQDKDGNLYIAHQFEEVSKEEAAQILDEYKNDVAELEAFLGNDSDASVDQGSQDAPAADQGQPTDQPAAPAADQGQPTPTDQPVAPATPAEAEQPAPADPAPAPADPNAQPSVPAPEVAAAPADPAAQPPLQ